MNTGTVIALILSSVSTVAAAISLVLNFREGSRRDEEIRYLRAEGGRREEELNLLRQQLEDERKERLQEQRAQLVSTRNETRSDPHRIEYDLTVRNAGPYPAMGVAAGLEDAEHRPSALRSVALTLMPGEEATVTFTGFRPLEPTSEVDALAMALVGQTVFLEWWDGLGHHREPTNLSLNL